MWHVLVLVPVVAEAVPVVAVVVAVLAAAHPWQAVVAVAAVAALKEHSAVLVRADVKDANLRSSAGKSLTPSRCPPLAV